MNLGELSLKAVNGLLNADQQEILQKCLDEMETLLRKNTDYGSSVFQRPRLAPHISPSDSILVRMSDKLNRLDQLAQQGAMVASESFDDTLRDFAAYVKLYQIASEREHGQEKEEVSPQEDLQAVFDQAVEEAVARPHQEIPQAYRRDAGRIEEISPREVEATLRQSAQGSYRPGDLGPAQLPPVASHRAEGALPQASERAGG